MKVPQIPLSPKALPKNTGPVELPPAPAGHLSILITNNLFPSPFPGEPEDAQYLGMVEWAWAPFNSRIEGYYLSLEGKYWVLWSCRLNDHVDPWEWEWSSYAYCSTKFTGAKVAAVYLLRDSWRREAEDHLDRFHILSDVGDLCEDEFEAIADQVWGGVDMYGAIAGDIIGSQYERHNTSNYHFELFTEHSSFTDDTVMTVAVMESLNGWLDLEPCIRKWQALFPNAGFGPRFQAWIGGHAPGDSFGNGGAMRISPYAWMPYTWNDFQKVVEDGTSITHGSKEAIDAAWAIASTIRHIREGESRESVQGRLQDIAPEYHNLTWPPRVKKPGALARESVPAALAAALTSTSFEDAIRKAISIGGDSDTIASMTGAVAEAMYSVPDEIAAAVRDRLTPDMLKVLDDFYDDWVNLDPAVVEANPSFMFTRAAGASYEQALRESFQRMKARKEEV